VKNLPRLPAQQDLSNGHLPVLVIEGKL